MNVNKTNILVSIVCICLMVLYLYKTYQITGLFLQNDVGNSHQDARNVRNARNSNGRSGLDGRTFESEILATPSEKHKQFIIFIIPSKPELIQQRHDLRTTWLNLSLWNDSEFKGIDKHFLDFKLMFVIGKYKNAVYTDELMEEVSKNNDMYLVNLVESRSVIRDKVLWGMRKSIELYHYNFIVKIDHDTLVDLPHLLKGIQRLRRENVYTGRCEHTLIEGVGRRRIKLQYCLSGAYILSRDIVEKISSLSQEEINYDEDLLREDRFVGWLVQQTRKKYKTPIVVRTIAHARGRQIVNNHDRGVRRGYYRFNSWFYHWPSLHDMDKFKNAFECRIRSNVFLCPSMIYTYKNTEICRCNQTSIH